MTNSPEDSNFEKLPLHEDAGTDLTAGLALDGTARKTLEHLSKRRLLERAASFYTYGPETDLTMPEFEGSGEEFVRLAQREILSATQDTENMYSVWQQPASMQRSWAAAAATYVDAWHSKFNAAPLPQRIMGYFSHTVNTIMTSPYVMADTQFRVRKQEILKDFPDDPQRVAGAVFKQGENPQEVVEGIDRALRAIPYEAPFGDLRRLPQAERDAALGYLYAECQKLYMLADRYGVADVVQRVTGRMIFRPVDDLEKVITSGVLSPAKAVWEFLHPNADFDEALARVPETESGVTQTSFERLENGETVWLSKKDEQLAEAQMRARIDTVVAEVVQGLHGLTDDTEQTPLVVRWSSATVDITKAMLQKLPHARRIDLQVTSVPFTNESMQTLLKQGWDDTIVKETIRQLRFTVQLKSTGKPVVPSSIDVVLLARKPEGKRPAFEKRLVNRAQGAKKVAALAQESKEIAADLELRGMSRPYGSFETGR